MSNQHFLPASYIGRFSLATDARRRKRPIWVQRVGRAPYRASAEYVGGLRGFYDLEKPSLEDAKSVDHHWRYEAQLPAALDALSDRKVPLDGRMWAQTLVPFIASIFIRGPDFKARYEARFPGVTGPARDGSEPLLNSWQDNTLASGQIEWQRLLAPVMAANWTVIHGSGAPTLPTNDVAHCMMRFGSTGRIGYAFPLDPSTVLVLSGRPVRRILEWDGSRWIAVIEHADTSDADLSECRTAIKHGAFKEVYGPTRDSVLFPSEEFQPNGNPYGPVHLIPMDRPRGLIPYSYDYFKVLTMLESDAAAPPIWDGLPDWSVVARSWSGPIQQFVDLPYFPGGLFSVHISRPARASHNVITSRVAFSAVYLDLTRFSAEDVDRYAGKNQLDPVSRDPSPALRQLLDGEIATLRC